MEGRFLADLSTAVGSPRWASRLEGSKAAGLVDLARLSLPLPTTYVVDGAGLLAQGGSVSAELAQAVALLEEEAGARFGDLCVPLPLTVSVRCGDKVVERALPESLLSLGGSPPAALALGERILEERRGRIDLVCGQLGVAPSAALLGGSPLEQLVAGVELLLAGLAAAGAKDQTLLVQRMVYGNAGPRSVSGTAYSRHPQTGEELDYGKYLTDASPTQCNAAPVSAKKDLSQLRLELPEAYARLRACLARLEEHHRDVRFVEFIVQEGELFLLQNTVRNRRAGAYRPREP